MEKLDYSEWYPLSSEAYSRLVPDSPGVYQVRTDFEFGRLRGDSEIVSIGSAAQSLRSRLIGQRVGDPQRYMSRAEKLLRNAGHILEFRFVTTSDSITARNLEAELLAAYESEHWELPPSNGVLPRPKT